MRIMGWSSDFCSSDLAVVGALRKRKNARTLVLGIARERVGFDLLADIVRLELFQRNGADDAQVVARGAQEDRNGASHGDGGQDGHVAERKRVGAGKSVSLRVGMGVRPTLKKQD